MGATVFLAAPGRAATACVVNMMMRVMVTVALLLSGVATLTPAASACQEQVETPVSSTCVNEYGSPGDGRCEDEGDWSSGFTEVWTTTVGGGHVYVVGSGSCSGGPYGHQAQWFWVTVGVDDVGSVGVGGYDEAGPYSGWCALGVDGHTQPTGAFGVRNAPCVYGLPYVPWGHLFS